MSDKVKSIKESEFQSEVLDSELPVIVDFWAPWCGPCKMIAPIMDELSVEYDGKIKFVKINTDDARNVAVKYGIMGIPTLKIFRGGSEINSISGAAPKPHLKNWIDAALAG